MIQWAENLQVIQKDDKAVLINCLQETWLRINKIAIEDCNNNIIGRRKDQIKPDFLNLYEIMTKYKMITDKGNVIKHFSKVNTIYFLVTLKCNMECDFCCICASPQNLSDDLGKAELIKLINGIAGIDVKKVILTGGEPLLYENIDFLVSELRKRVKSKIQICTNGLLINTSNISFFSKIDLIDISVENLFFESQEFEIEELTKKIYVFKELGIGICLSYVVTEYNWKLIYKFLDYAYINDVKISIKIVSPAGRAETKTDILISEEKAFYIMVDIYNYIYKNKYFNDKMEEFLFPAYLPEKQCAASGKILSVYPDGNTYSCFLLNKNPFCLGNIKKNSLQEIIINNKLKNNTELYKQCFDKDNKEVCKECEARYFCEGNCIGVSANRNILCKFHKKYFSYYIWYYSELKSIENNLKDFLKYIRE